MMGKARTSPWTEVNILPVSAKEPERLLTGVVDPLVHDVLAGHWDRWHFFWEPELRLRFRWAPESAPPDCRSELIGQLNLARSDGLLTSWEETPYHGEASDYGREVWEAVVADWMSGSELALAIIRAGKHLTMPREYHWERRTHLFTDQLLLPEVAMHLTEADARLEMAWPSSDHPRIAGVRYAIDRYFADDSMIKAEASGFPHALAKLLAAGEPQVSQ